MIVLVLLIAWAAFIAGFVIGAVFAGKRRDE